MMYNVAAALLVVNLTVFDSPLRCARAVRRRAWRVVFSCTHYTGCTQRDWAENE